jgi:hypothetical protein
MSDRPTKRATEWFTPDASTSAYAPSPHVAPDFYSLLTSNEERIIRWLTSPKVGRQLENKSWVCGQLSYAKIAAGTGLHWTTVKRAILGLKAKQSLDTRDVWSRDRAGGRRMGTLVSVPSFEDALERRRAIPDAAVTAVGHIVYIGRARRIMTKAQAAAWKIDLHKAPRSYAAEQKRRRPAAAAAAPPREGYAPAAPATGPPQEEQESPMKPKPEPLPRQIRNALKACVRQKLFTDGHAERLVLNARKIALQRGMALTDDDIVACIEAGWESAKREVLTIAFYNTALPDKVNALLDERGDRIAEWRKAGGQCPECGGRGVRAAVVRGVGTTVRCDCTTLEQYKQLQDHEIPADAKKNRAAG